MRRRWRVGRPVHLLLALLATAALTTTMSVAWAYWTADGSGSGDATAGTIAAPEAPVATATTTHGAVSVSWKPVRAPSGGHMDGYYVQRHTGGVTVTACGSSAASPLPASQDTCTDKGVPNGDSTYTVVAVFGSWTAESDHSAPVTLDGTAFVVDAPASIVAGQPAAVTVTAVDGSGATNRRYQGTVTFTSSDPGSPVLPADYTFTRNDQGTKSFPAGIELRTAGTQWVMVTDTVQTSISGSALLTVTPAAPDHLAFAAQPSQGTSNVAWAPQPEVVVRDVYGNTVTDGSATVDLSVATGTPGGALSCATTSLAASGGVAAFSDCTIDKSGSYTLAATSTGLTGATSSAFDVTHGAATTLVVTGQPSNVVAGEVISPTVTVEVRDAAGNVVTGDPTPVDLSIGTNPAGGTLGGRTSVVSRGGVAAFADLTIDRSSASSYTLRATSPGLTTATSAGFTVTAGAPAKVGFTVQPGGGTGGVNWSPQPRVAIQDALGNQVLTSSASVTLAITPGTGTAGAVLTCSSNPRVASGGLASFGGCKIDKAGTDYTLTASSAGLTSDTSAPFTVAVGPATRLGWTVPPSNVTAGSTISPAPTVAIQDAGGNTVTTSSATINLAIGTNPAGGTLSGSVSAATSNGTASFPDLSVDRSSASSYTLVASATSLTSATSTGFVVSAGAPTQLGFTVQPGGGTGGVAWGTQPRVAIQDALGNTVLTSTAGVTLAITPGTGTSGAALTCTNNPRNASSGVATFSSCRIDKAGTGYTLTATSGSLTADVSTSFAVAVGPAAKLAYTQQPTAVTAGSAISPAVRVVVQDAGGNTVTTSTATVTMAIGTNPASGTLSGTVSRAAVSGVATFSNLSINRSSASNYTLVASSAGLTSATSSGFVVSAGPAAQIAFTTQPGGGTINTAWAQQPRVTVQDAQGNTVSSTASVQLTIQSGTAGAGLTCTTNPRAASGGVATFAGCRIDRAGTYTLRAASGSWTTISGSFTVS